jgi:hypothetical protein
MKIGNKVTIRNHSNIVSNYWGKAGEVIEIKKEDIIKRTKKSHWNPVKVGEQTVYRIKFEDESLPTPTLLLPIEFFVSGE